MFESVMVTARTSIHSKWDNLLEHIGDDELFLNVIGTNILINFIYWTYGGLFALIDLTNKPKFIRKYKIQSGINEPLDKTKLKSALKSVIFNHIAIGIPVSFFMYIVYTWRGMPPVRELPSIKTLFIDLFGCLVFEEIAFYYSHRMLHSKHIYKWIHKKHHEWTAPIALTAVYCHPVEHIFSNILPAAMGILIMKAHLFTAWIWFTIAVINTLTDHSGYDFPFSPGSVKFHDYHHEKFSNNFGVIGILDRLHGTDKKYRLWKKRNNNNVTKFK